MIRRLRNWLVGWLFGWRKTCLHCLRAKPYSAFVKLPYYSAGGLSVSLYPVCEKCFDKLDPHIIMWHCEEQWAMRWKRNPKEFPVAALAQSIMERKENE